MNIADFHMMIPVRASIPSKLVLDTSLTPKEQRFFSLIDGKLSLAALGILAGESPQDILLILKKLLLLRIVNFYQVNLDAPGIPLSEEEVTSWDPNVDNCIAPEREEGELWTPVEQRILTSAFRIEQSLSGKKGKKASPRPAYESYPSNDSINGCGEFLRLSSPSLPDWDKDNVTPAPETSKPVKDDNPSPSLHLFNNTDLWDTNPEVMTTEKLGNKNTPPPTSRLNPDAEGKPLPPRPRAERVASQSTAAPLEDDITWPETESKYKSTSEE